MLKIGITGGIGTGKTTVCRVFETLGIPVFDADTESKLIVQRDESVVKQVKAIFGEDVYPNGLLDRKKLADIVFNNPEKLALLNSITHPAVFQKFGTWASVQHDVPYVIKEAALIYEAGGDAHLDKVIVVNAPQELRIQRIMLRNHAGEEEVRARMKYQWTEEEKLKRADFIIYNDGEQLIIPQVLRIHEALTKQ